MEEGGGGVERKIFFLYVTRGGRKELAGQHRKSLADWLAAQKRSFCLPFFLSVDLSSVDVERVSQIAMCLPKQITNVKV